MDTVVRFWPNDKYDHSLPFQFYLDILSVVFDESRHFNLIEERMIFHNSYYG